VLSVWDFSKVNFTLLIKSFETDGILFVNVGLFHGVEFGSSDVISSKPFRFLWENDCIVLEFYKLNSVKSAESFFVLS